MQRKNLNNKREIKHRLKNNSAKRIKNLINPR